MGDVPLKPGFCMPRPPPAPFPVPAARGFFRLDRNGLRTAAGVTDDPPSELNVVIIDIVLPFVCPAAKYGFPLASVIDTVPPLPPPPPAELILLLFKFRKKKKKKSRRNV